MNKLTTVEEAVSIIKDGDTLMIGGFYTVGTPHDLAEEIIRQNKKDLTIINNDGGNPDSPLGRLIYSGNVKKVILSWCGYLNELPDMVKSGKIELELNPQGTLIERIRAGGFGLGGVLTKSGINTIIEEAGYGKRVHLNGEDWLYHPPLKADVTLIEAYKADNFGNLLFRGTQRNFNDIMCYAGNIVIASVKKPIKKKGELAPDTIMVQGPVVDYLVQQEV
ncbi:MAG: CoA transferase subunit A [Clostridiales bacterium]|nr:CoA transferase subunit A [Clostridiales bacterium]